MKELIIIAGPTAVGKTGVSIKIAEELGCEIISADSMQVYKGMDIGSAKIKSSEMQGIRHHLIDILEPEDDFNVAMFKNLATAAIKDIKSRGKIPMIVGGTGFYIQSVLYGIDFKGNETDPEVREKLESEAERYGKEYIISRLEECDPVSAEKNKGNMKRMIRSLEYNILTGKKMSDKIDEEKKHDMLYNAGFYVLTMPRDMLYERIDRRVDTMMKDGLENEVRSLYESGLDASYNSMQGLGYKQLLRYFSGGCDLETATDDIKKETRHFAKRQLTWFRREKNVKWIDMAEYNSINEAADEIIEGIRNDE